MGLLSLPVDVVRAVVHAVTGGGHVPPAGPRPADDWELRHAGLEPRTAGSRASTEARGSDQGHSHDHGHTHDHGHSHDHGGPREEAPSSAVEPAAPAVVVVETANPLARKLQANRPLGGRRVRSYDTAWDAAGDALAEALFDVPGVDGVYVNADFVTVTLTEGTEWDAIEAALVDVVMARLS